jgi:branched-chain amino acid aminotransferase
MAGLSFVESRVACVNGEFVPVEEATVSVFDRGFLYGDGVYETLGLHAGRLFRLNDHLERLYQSASLIGLGMTVTRDELRASVLETVRRNGFADAYVRIVVSRGPSFPSMDPRAATQAPTIVVLCHSRVQPPGLSSFFGPDGLRLQIVSVRKTPSVSLDPHAKTLNYLNQMMARMEATNSGADEAVLYDMRGYLAEGAGDNIFAVHGEELITPTAREILIGITRTTIIELATDLGYELRERDMTAYDLYAANEVFLTSTYGGVLPVAAINGRRVGDGKVPGKTTAALVSAYERELSESGELVDLEPITA